MKAFKKYSHLFFDLDNTLWDFTTNSYHAMKSAFVRVERQFDETEFNQLFHVYSNNNRLLWDEYRKGNILKKELVSLRFKLTFDALDVKGIDPLEMNDIYLDEMPGQKRLVNGALSVLDYLSAKGYNMFIITNGFTKVQHKKLESSGISKYFKKVFISEEIMAPKPAPAIFEYALMSANAPKSGSLMIGDDLESDARGALRFGIDAVLLEPAENAGSELLPGSIPSRNRLFRINALSQIRDIV